MSAHYDHRNSRLSFTEEDAEARRLIARVIEEEAENSELETVDHGSDDDQILDEQKPTPLRASLTRALALLCVCSLSVGSHYASYILGPLKSRLSREMGTSNTEFSLLLAALASSGTWTPLLGGYMAQRLGTATSSIIATGTVFTGQLLLLLGHLYGDVRVMTLGMFVFGLGISPLAVVQETIIVRFFKSHSLGVSLALGLVAGKGASFLAARTSYPLSQYSPSAPFYVATAATFFSFVVNLIYISISKWLIRGSGTDYEVVELLDEVRRRSQSFNLSEAEALQKVVDKRRVRLKHIFKLGDVFWAYIGLNVLCGCIWSPFTHLAPNILERRYSLSELDASTKASYLLGGSMLLYPICGFVVDKAKKRSIVIQLLACSSVLTLLCYAWLSLPPRLTGTPWPAIVSFGTALGFAPLLLVVIVPRLVPLDYVSTTLGMHKSLEHTGVTIFQTVTGLWLDMKKNGSTSPDDDHSVSDRRLQWLLNTFVFFNILQLIGIWGLGYLDRRKKRSMSVNGGDGQGNEHVSQQRVPLLRSRPNSPIDEGPGYVIASESRGRPKALPEPVSPAEIKRGRVFALMSLGMVVFAWILFLTVSFVKIRSKQDREGRPVR